MAYLNIGGDANDTSYRYKMPRLVTKVEGRGNGIKTVIVNMTDIAKALHVDPGYPTKFFGIELGAQSKYNEETERAVVNGCHDQPDLAKLLEKFIDLFVLCPNCRLPEIKMVVSKKVVKIDCAACGHNGVLRTTHKLLTYIVNHAEETKAKKSADKEEASAKKEKKGEKKAEKKGEKEEKKEKKVKSEKAEKAEKADKEEDEDEGDEEEEEAKPKKKKDKDEEEVHWFTDTSKAAVKARKEQEFAEMKANDLLKKVENIQIDPSGDKSPGVVLKTFIASGKRTPDEIQDELKRLQLARGLNEPQKIAVLLSAIIDPTDTKNVHKQYANNATLLKLFAPNRLGATTLLNCLEEQVGVVERQLTPRIALILQVLYEANVLEEEVILSWYNSPPESAWLVNKDVAEAVRAKAAPFVKWLEEAEEEDESDS